MQTKLLSSDRCSAKDKAISFLLLPGGPTIMSLLTKEREVTKMGVFTFRSCEFLNKVSNGVFGFVND